MVYHISQFFPNTLKKLSSSYHKTPPQSFVQKKKKKLTRIVCYSS